MRIDLQSAPFRVGATPIIRYYPPNITGFERYGLIVVADMAYRSFNFPFES